MSTDPTPAVDAALLDALAAARAEAATARAVGVELLARSAQHLRERDAARAALAAAAPDERALTRVIEEAMFEHDATWLGDWAGGTTCRRCGAIDTSTTAHLAQSAAAAATAWFAARPAPVVSGEAVARAMRSAIDRDYVEVFYDLDEAQGYSSVDDLIETVSERIATALTVADEGRAGA